jgi:hypothetical protein
MQQPGRIAPRDGGSVHLVSSSKFESAREARSLPLPLWERYRPPMAAVLRKYAEAKLRLCRIARCDPGEGLSSIEGPEPLTPTLSHRGEGAHRHCRDIMPEGEAVVMGPRVPAATIDVVDVTSPVRRAAL